MLIYVRSTNDESGTRDSTAVTQPPGMDSNEDTTKSQPPQRALAVVDDINEKHIQSCNDYARRCAMLYAHLRVRLNSLPDKKNCTLNFIVLGERCETYTKFGSCQVMRR